MSSRPSSLKRKLSSSASNPEDMPVAKCRAKEARKVRFDLSQNTIHCAPPTPSLSHPAFSFDSEIVDLDTDEDDNDNDDNNDSIMIEDSLPEHGSQEAVGVANSLANLFGRGITSPAPASRRQGFLSTPRSTSSLSPSPLRTFANFSGGPPSPMRPSNPASFSPPPRSRLSNSSTVSSSWTSAWSPILVGDDSEQDTSMEQSEDADDQHSLSQSSFSTPPPKRVFSPKRPRPNRGSASASPAPGGRFPAMLRREKSNSSFLDASLNQSPRFSASPSPPRLRRSMSPLRPDDEGIDNRNEQQQQEPTSEPISPPTFSEQDSMATTGSKRKRFEASTATRTNIPTLTKSMSELSATTPPYANHWGGDYSEASSNNDRDNNRTSTISTLKRSLSMGSLSPSYSPNLAPGLIPLIPPYIATPPNSQD